MAENTVILRPDATLFYAGFSEHPVDIDHHELINEKIADDESTYIFSDDQTDNKILFSLAGIFPNDNIVITSLKIFSRRKISHGLDGNVDATYKLIFDEYEVAITDSINTYNVDEGTCHWEDFYSTFVNTEKFISEINNFIKSYGMLPSLNLEILVDKTYDGGYKDGPGAYFTQIYIELVYETKTTIGIFKKNSGAYNSVATTYKKSGESWFEISEDEAKAILKTSTIRRG